MISFDYKKHSDIKKLFQGAMKKGILGYDVEQLMKAYNYKFGKSMRFATMTLYSSPIFLHNLCEDVWLLLLHCIVYDIEAGDLLDLEYRDDVLY